MSWSQEDNPSHSNIYSNINWNTKGRGSIVLTSQLFDIRVSEQPPTSQLIKDIQQTAS